VNTSAGACVCIRDTVCVCEFVCAYMCVCARVLKCLCNFRFVPRDFAITAFPTGLKGQESTSCLLYEKNPWIRLQS